MDTINSVKNFGIEVDSPCPKNTSGKGRVKRSYLDKLLGKDSGMKKK